MVLAYVLITTIGRKESEVAVQLTNMAEISSVHTLYGEYDLIVRLKTSNMEKLRDLMINHIPKIEGIDKTTTLIVADQTKEDDNVVKRFSRKFF